MKNCKLNNCSLQGYIYMSLNLKDPRQFSAIYPDSNILINQALHDLSTPNQDNQLMTALITDLLKQSQDQTLSVAYNLAPSQATADYIWDSLQTALNKPEQNKIAKLFALPIILVIGSTQQITLNNQIDQVKLTQLLAEKQVLTHSDNSFISGKLYDIDGISKLRPSNLFRLITQLDNIDSWNEEQFSAKEITSLGEEVHLRFLIGITLVEKGQDQNLIPANYTKLGLNLLELISISLRHDSATIFPIPFPPCALSEASVVGEYYRNEINLSLRLSNLVKKLRLDGKYPDVKVSSQENKIQIEVWLANSTSPEETIHWQLHRADNFPKISQTIADLFSDMQLNVIYDTETKYDNTH